MDIVLSRILKLKSEKKISDTQFTKDLHFYSSIVSEWKNGSSKSYMKHLPKIADYFGTTVDAILNGKTDTKEKPIFDLPGAFELGEFATIELVANIRAGYDGVAIADVSELISVPALMLKGYPPEECKAFIVVGNSMYPKFEEGDYVIIHVQSSVDSGDTAVIIYNDDEASIKKIRYVYGEDWLEMIPANPEYMTKRIEGEDIQSCHIYGKVISMMRL